MPLLQHHRRWLLVQQGLVPGLINLVINAGIAWLLMRRNAQLALWGEAGVGGDLLITGFLLPFVLCLINSRVIASGVTRGKIPALVAEPSSLGDLHRRSGLSRSLVLGALGLLLFAVPTVALLHICNVEDIPLSTFVGFKGVWAGLLASAVSPLVAWWALANASTLA